MKLLLRDPIPLGELCEKLRRLGLGMTPEREKWLAEHYQHAGLQLDRDRYYCRTCDVTDAKAWPGDNGKAGPAGRGLDS